MGKFSGILICTDLDGTLYRSDKTISRENKEATEYFKSEGGLFTFVTGRLPYYSMDAYRAAQPNVPFSCINGGGLYDGESGEYVWACELPKASLEIVEHIDKSFPGAGIQISCHRHTYFAKETPLMKEFRRSTGLPDLFCHYREVGEPIAKILFGTDDEDEMQAILKALREHPLADSFGFIRSERTLCEILPKGIHKGVAVSKLTEHLGVSKEKTVAIGDYDNDVGMFGAVKLGIAVANSSPAALAAADLVTVSNDEHAIAKVIYDIESGKIEL